MSAADKEGEIGSDPSLKAKYMASNLYLKIMKISQSCCIYDAKYLDNINLFETC